MYFFFIFIAVEVSIISFWFSLQLHNFKRHLAQLIGDLDDSIAAEEDAIVSKVKSVVRDYRDVKSVSALVTGGGDTLLLRPLTLDRTVRCNIKVS